LPWQLLLSIYLYVTTEVATFEGNNLQKLTQKQFNL